MKFRNNFFGYSLILLILAVVIIAYVRFMVVRDYMIAYEAECDSVTENCFIGCEDEECLSIYYYTLIEKPAADVYAQCGPKIESCDAIDHCLPTNDDNCAKLYCDPAIDGDLCETITLESMPIPALIDANPIQSEMLIQTPDVNHQSI